MANDNHLSSVTLYNVTMQKQEYYNDFFELGQQKINFNFFELNLPDDDPVYTLKKVMEDLDFMIAIGKALILSPPFPPLNTVQDTFTSYGVPGARI